MRITTERHIERGSWAQRKMTSYFESSPIPDLLTSFEAFSAMKCLAEHFEVIVLTNETLSRAFDETNGINIRRLVV